MFCNVIVNFIFQKREAGILVSEVPATYTLLPDTNTDVGVAGCEPSVRNCSTSKKGKLTILTRLHKIKIPVISCFTIDRPGDLRPNGNLLAVSR